MTTYATSIYNYVGRRLSWSSNGGPRSDQPQRPSSHDLLAGEPSPPSHHTLHTPPQPLSPLLVPQSATLQLTLAPAIDVQPDGNQDDAVSEQTLVAVEHIPARVLRPPMPGAGDPASYSGNLEAGAAAGTAAAAGEPDNSLINNATSDFDPPTMSPPEGSSQAQTSAAAAVRTPTDTRSPMAGTSLGETVLTSPTTVSGNNDITRSDESNTMRSSALPEDDGKRALRQSLVEIHKLDITEREKAKRMHAIMTENYNALKERKRQSKQVEILPPEREDPFEVTPEDAKKSYHKENEMGCTHYKRGVKLQCSTCRKWHTCRFCHDEAEDHILIRRETKNMLCMHCGKAQPAQQDCRHCGVKSARYYCDKCKLWDDDPEKKIYHCDDCGICRIGAGLGKDFFHCKKCGVCMSIRLQEYHRCIERSTECDCPICGEFMFTSTQTVVFMKCGHSIHHKCYYEHMKSSYRCPTCYRTIINMESQFRALDNEISNQALPTPYDSWRCLISCNDCSARSNVSFHFLGLKCETCRSYNTNQNRLIRPEDDYAISPPTSDAGIGRSPPGSRQYPHAHAHPHSSGGAGRAPTLLAATVAIGNPGTVIDMVTSGSANPDRRLIYDDGWDSSDDEDEGEGSVVGDDNWSRCGSETGEEVDDGGLVPGLGGLGGMSLFGGEETAEEEPTLEEDEEEEDDDFFEFDGA